MKRIVCLFVCLFVGSVNAGMIDIYVGDNDGFGVGIADNGNTGGFSIPTDNRDASEVSATNGAQQTDFYSTLFNPLPESFDVSFSLTDNLTSAIFEVDVADLQAVNFGQLAVSFNGVLQSNLFNFEDGFTNSAIHSFTLDSNTLFNANAVNEFVVTFDRNGSNDALAFDYFRLTGETTSVPEPTSLALLGLGLAGIGFSRKKKAS